MTRSNRRGPMKILLVEDDDAVRHTLLDILSYRQYVAEGVASAEEALARLPDEYDLVVSDVFLQGMDGVALLDAVNRMRPAVPVVIITGFSDLDIEQKCRQKGAAAFLRKPFTIDSLLEIMDEVAKK